RVSGSWPIKYPPIVARMPNKYKCHWLLPNLADEKKCIYTIYGKGKNFNVYIHIQKLLPNKPDESFVFEIKLNHENVCHGRFDNLTFSLPKKFRSESHLSSDSLLRHDRRY